MTDSLTLREISDCLKGQILSGDPDALITGVSSIQEAGPSDICYYGSTKYAGFLASTNAMAVIVSRPVETSAECVLLVEDAYDAFRKVLHLFKPDRFSAFSGLHSSAVIHSSACIGENVRVGPSVVIDRDCIVGDNCSIGSGSVLGPGVILGSDCLIHPNVTLLDGTCAGNNVIVHSGTVAGSDGFGFVPDAKGEHKKIPQNGNVVIGNHVEIGANCTIDRAVTGSTKIGDHTKLDNLIQVAHNVSIGRGCFIAAQTGIAGSTAIGNGVVFGGQVGVGGHLVINDGAVIAAKSGVTKDVDTGITVSGNPARPHMENLRLGAAVSRLPKIIELVKELKTGKIEETGD
ncbi:MAG: UDP-3-O-(3-hydroxymyristoyl)glucosamine N-acyltransferase [Candidatus Sabulitectum sp.]|nr:UDP-3-O-(3-hydroxymyristoyl)glucosamine N-acyltransferase [Candidatus Sabulitectum sp.]